MKKILATTLSTFVITVMCILSIPITSLAASGSSDNISPSGISISEPGPTWNSSAENLITSSIFSIGVHITGFDLGDLEKAVNSNTSLMSTIFSGKNANQIITEAGKKDAYKEAIEQIKSEDEGTQNAGINTLTEIMNWLMNDVMVQRASALKDGQTPVRGCDNYPTVAGTLYDTILPEFTEIHVNYPVVTFINDTFYWYHAGNLTTDLSLFSDDYLNFYMIPTNCPHVSRYNDCYLRAFVTQILKGEANYSNETTNAIVRSGLTAAYWGKSPAIYSKQSFEHSMVGLRDDGNRLPKCPIYLYSLFIYRCPDGAGQVRRPDVFGGDQVVNGYYNLAGMNPAEIAVPGDSIETLGASNNATTSRGYSSRETAWLSLVPAGDKETRWDAWSTMMYDTTMFSDMYSSYNDEYWGGLWSYQTLDTRGAMNFGRNVFYNPYEDNASVYAAGVKVSALVPDLCNGGAGINVSTDQVANQYGYIQEVETPKRYELTSGLATSYGKGWFGLAGPLTEDQPPVTSSGAFEYSIDARPGRLIGTPDSNLSKDKQPANEFVATRGKPKEDWFGIHLHPGSSVETFSVGNTNSKEFEEAFIKYEGSGNCVARFTCKSLTGETSKPFNGTDKQSAHISNVQWVAAETDTGKVLDIKTDDQGCQYVEVVLPPEEMWNWINNYLTSVQTKFSFVADNYETVTHVDYWVGSTHYFGETTNDLTYAHVTDWEVTMTVPEDLNIKMENNPGENVIDGVHQNRNVFKAANNNSGVASGTGADADANRRGWYSMGPGISLGNVNDIYGSHMSTFWDPGKKPPTIEDSATPVAWHIETMADSKAYGEIVGNAVGGSSGTDLAQDWNVSQGIPSTENVSVALGGESFKIALGGVISGMGSRAYSSVDNTEQGSASGSTALTRTITFKVNIHDIWGNTSAGDPTCDLSCPGHVECSGGHSWSQSVTASASGDATDTQTIPTWTCPKCSQVVPEESVTVSGSWGTTEDGDRYPITNSSTITHQHDCTWTCSYNCGTKTAWISSSGPDSLAATTCSPSINATNQRYNATGTVTNGSESVNWTHTDNSLKCEGYTTPGTYGCRTPDPANCVHHISRDYTYTLKENIDMFAYREITAAKAYALSHAKITKADNNLFAKDIVGEGTTNLNMSLNIWQGAGDANMSTKTGRLWFTQWKNPNYSNGWTTSNDPDYWLGNCTIRFSAYADSELYGEDFAIKDCIVHNNQGFKDRHYKPVGSNSEVYKKELGDWGDPSETKNESMHIVNAWMNANNTNYGAIVISDLCEITSIDNVSQNVVDECYSLDHIPLFNAPFQNGRSTINRYHKNKFDTLDLAIQDLDKQDIVQNYTDCGTLNQDFRTFFTGYSGKVTTNPVNKYTITPVSAVTGTELRKALTKGGSTLSRYKNYNELWSASGTIKGTAQYDKTKAPTALTTPATIQVNLESTGTRSNQTFDGYYTKFIYPTGNYNYVAKTTGSTAQATLVTGMHNSGALNGLTSSDGKTYSTYTKGRGEYSPLTISNLQLDKYAYNREYIEPIEAHTYYTGILDMDNKPQCKNSLLTSKFANKYGYNDFDDLEYKAEFKPYAGKMNNIVVHTPVSVQYDQFIGNGYGYYASGVVDESGEDMRHGYPKEEYKKPNYALIGNTCHIWITDFGDYRDSTGTDMPNITGKTNRGTGSTLDGANPKTGEINKSAKGYTDNMNTGIWVAKREVRFDFPVSYTDTSGNRQVLPAGRKLDLSTVKVFDDWHYGSDALQNTMSYDKEFKWGRDYEFTILTSSLESKKSYVYFYAQAINDHNKIDEDPCEDHNINRLSNTKKAASFVEKVPSIELAGRIGNLAIEDCGDFRFSNLFKTPTETEWLIPGVVHKVNSARPNMIMSTFNDILLDMTGHANTTKSHSTLSITSYPYGGETGLGKAGQWMDLPLVAARNNIDEFKTEQPRIGYETFLDLETIGMYYGTDSTDATATYPNAAEEEGVIPDTRKYTMHIIPKYMLYDYANGKFYAVDLYGGTEGNYTKYYGGADIGSAKYFAESGLYIDFPQGYPVTTNSLTREEERRNVPVLEKQITKLNADRFDRKDAAYKEADYIGTAYNIVLDAADRDFIGSKFIRYDSTDPASAVNNKSLNQLGSDTNMTSHNRNSGLIGNGDFEINSQRWHFTLNLPSSTRITYARPSSVLNLTQTEIVNEAERLKKEHPTSVLITFLDITVDGLVYTLQYDARIINDGVVNVTLFGDTKPDSWKPEYTNNIVLDGDTLTVYDEHDNPIDTIDPEWPPIIVNEPYETSDKDLETYGTH